MTLMTPERFARIVDAYGADSRRWPDAEREAARAFAQAHPGLAQARLAQAAALDACLSADLVEPASRALQRRIVASANVPGRRRAEASWPMRWWLSGAAFAGVGAAGLAAGVLAVSSLMVAGEHASATAAHEPAYLSTGFDTSSAEGSVE